MKYAKTIVAVLAAAAVAAQAALTDDVITAAEWFTVVLAGAGALGVWAVPNRADTAARSSAPRERPY